MFDKAGGAISYATDKGPGSMKNSLVGHRNKIFDPISDHSGKPGRAPDEVQASDNPSGPEECSRNVVPG